MKNKPAILTGLLFLQTSNNDLGKYRGEILVFEKTLALYYNAVQRRALFRRLVRPETWEMCMADGTDDRDDTTNDSPEPKHPELERVEEIASRSVPLPSPRQK
jgi:hypothetical protein